MVNVCKHFLEFSNRWRVSLFLGFVSSILENAISVYQSWESPVTFGQVVSMYA